MSFLSRAFPFLFEDADESAACYAPDRLKQASREEKVHLIQHGATPGAALLNFAQDPDSDIRILLAKRLSALLPKVKTSDAQTAQALLEALRQLTEDSVTPVRVALASALKDVANIPPAIARRLADDAERAVAEPIIRYSLGLGDEDLLELIAQHPEEWHVLSIAHRKRLTEIVSDSLVDLGNEEVSEALLANDGASIGKNRLEKMAGNPRHARSVEQRNSLERRLKRDFLTLTERSLYIFLRQNAQLDKKTTNDVLKTIHRRVDVQNNLPKTDPALMTEEQLRDALVLGENEAVIKAFAARAFTTESVVQRMLVSSGAAKPVIALCVKAGLSMNFSVLCQQRLTRLSPDRIFYPRDGSQCPLTQEEIRWQLDFFGINTT